MNDKNRTASILQRLPVILAVTAASYGLTLPASARVASHSHGKVQQSQSQTVKLRLAGA